MTTLARPEPTTKGTAGEAWKLPIADAHRARGTVAAWAAIVPCAHPLWAWYFVSLIHLRPVPRQPGLELEPWLAFDGASHEISVHAARGANLELPADEVFRGQLLAPQNLVVQLCGLEDAQAELVVEQLVEVFVAGRVSPDTDWRQRQLGFLTSAQRVIRPGSPHVFDVRQPLPIDRRYA